MSETTTAPHGAGAWKDPAYYAVSTAGAPRTTRIKAAVLGWTAALRAAGFPAKAVTAYDSNLAQVVASYQAFATGLTIDGEIGPHTARALIDHVGAQIANVHGVPYPFLLGIVRHESGYDCGAQGEITPRDYGLVQINLDAHPDVTVTAACNPIYALTWTAQRMFDAYQAYLDEGATVDLAWDAAILQHKSPVAAEALVKGGTLDAVNADDRAYITFVQSGG